jgi:hypothetical protein
VTGDRAMALFVFHRGVHLRLRFEGGGVVSPVYENRDESKRQQGNRADRGTVYSRLDGPGARLNNRLTT